LKIAFVKQDIYQDLYVCPNRSTPAEILASSIMRVGPIGLFSLYDADFLIIREGVEKECKAYLKSYRPPASVLRQLKDTPINRIKGSVFDFLAPRSGNSHKDFSVDASSVKWDNYDIVISINISVPTSIVKKYSSVLWCYMMGEASRVSPYAEFGYDVRLTQEVTGSVADQLGVVDFPYTFLGPACLENIAKEYGDPAPKKRGVFAEINTTSERPVAKVGQLEFVREMGHEVILHDQDIVRNVMKLKDSKYFIKLGGRKIRGNSVIESISAGTLALMNPKDVVHSQLMPKETWVHSEKEIKELIKELDADDEAYKYLLSEQRKRVSFFVVDTPMESLRNCLELKRNGSRPSRLKLVNTLREIRRNYF
jgi:hypothetical protein